MKALKQSKKEYKGCRSISTKVVIDTLTQYSIYKYLNLK